MSPLIPAALRAPQTAPAVQGAARATAPRSGDDFARALRQETGDRSASPARPNDRPARRDDRGDAARSARADGRPGETSPSQTSPSQTSPTQVTPTPTEPTATVGEVPAVPAVLVGVVGAPVETGTGTATGDAAVAGLVLGAAHPATAQPGTADAGGAGALTSLISASGEASIGVAPGAGLAPIGLTGLGATAAGATGIGAPAAGAAGLGAGNGRTLTATDQLNAAPSGMDHASAATTARPGETLPVAPALVPAVTGPAGGAGATTVDATPAAVAAVAPGASGGPAGGGGGAADGGAGGTGGLPVAESASPAAGSAPASHAGGFVQALAGLGGVERASATAATGPAGQASLAEQVRGPVLALRTAPLGEHVLTLKVTPENLGPVQVRAHIGADGIRIELVGATDAAREGLRGLLTDLRRDLAGTGMNASLSLGADSGSGGRAGHGAAGDLGSTGDGSPRDGSAQARSGRPTGATVTREPHPASAVPLTPTSSGAHGVDILT